MSRRRPAESGQATVLLVGALVAIVIGALVLGAVARGISTRSQAQGRANLAALAGARAMHAAYPRLFEPALIRGRANPRHLAKLDYLALGRSAARMTAAANGVAGAARIDFPDEASFAPVRTRVTITERVEFRRGSASRSAQVRATAEAELAPPDGLGSIDAGGDEYDGRLANRQGKPMRPDVALAFDRMERAAQADGVDLLVVSGFRSNAEQAVLFARHPDPKWVAPPGRSLHRLATELDLGPRAAYGWLATHAESFHFKQRYAWEPWHYGYVLNSRSTVRGDHADSDGERQGSSMPDFVPAHFERAIARAAQRWNVSSALLAAQLYAESNFNPFARSPVGAQGIAQFMPDTARGYGLTDPFDAEAAIDAQAHLMRDLLRQFGAVPLALAAYNAGPSPVRRCGCIPPFRETRGYVARILGLLGGAGEGVGGDGHGLLVRLVA